MVPFTLYATNMTTNYSCSWQKVDYSSYYSK